MLLYCIIIKVTWTMFIKAENKDEVIVRLNIGFYVDVVNLPTQSVQIEPTPNA